ncbi:MAG: methionyl-tRNA formyltransferase [Rickettsiales bacterium]|jgi:methionyl-tRNA formyltransferase|nr:methionyl-tRNA formyltransferase [Rickettsiales bacterium]
MKVILMGTSSWVVPVFDRAAGEHEIAAVFTRAPKPAGRRHELQKSPVHTWAEEKGLPVYTSIKQFDTVDTSDIAVIIVASYGVILRDNVLNAARLGCINIHPSDLPKYRGPAPMAAAVYNGDTESAVCVMRVAAEVDAGDIFIRKKFPIGENDTIADVEKRVGVMASEMLSEFLASPESFPPQEQLGEPTFTRKWTNDDELIDWNKTPFEIHNQIRSIGGRTKINGIDVKILKITIEDGKLKIENIQPAGKRPMPWRDFVNGQRGKLISFGD